MSVDDAHASICAACGLCCDGTIFAAGKLEPEERGRAGRLKLSVVSESHFQLPCPRHDGVACTVYEDRPNVCRKYECALRLRHAREPAELEEILRIARRTRELARRVSANLPDQHASLAERVARVFDAGGLDTLRGDPELALDIAELTMRLARDYGVGRDVKC
jgi:Fe-S-cluster containining protein